MTEQIVAHTSFLGITGFNAHSRNFFTRLGKYYPVRVRNYSYTNDLSNVPNEVMDMVIEQEWKDPPYKIGKPFTRNPNDTYVDIVLNESHHYFFYHDYQSPMISYNVWESTRQLPQFFNRILEFDQFWCPTEWQRQCTIEQGYPEDRVKVVPEGVNGNIFYPDPLWGKTRTSLFEKYNIPVGSFCFMIFGRWEYRKATTEIIQAFLEEFKNVDNVYLVISADNPFAVDKLNSTEERLKKYSLESEKIRVLHFPPREEYVQWMRSGNVFLSCSRSEGWNLPLIEAIASGTPTICSNWGAQLEFADGISNLVRVPAEKPPKDVVRLGDNPELGVWGEPDFDHLKKVMRETYENYESQKSRAVKLSRFVRNIYTWENAVLTGKQYIEELLSKTHVQKTVPQRLTKQKENMEYIVHFVDGPFAEVKGQESDDSFFIDFIDQDTKTSVHKQTIKINHWVRPYRKFFTNYLVQIRKNDELVFEHKYDAKGKKVIISLDSKSLGDTIAWFPYVEEFRKKHDCIVYVSTFWNHLFENNPKYSKLNFIRPGVVINNAYASYKVGCFDEDEWQNKFDWRIIPLQKVSSDCLGLKYKEVVPEINIPKKEREIEEKYVTISEFSTAQPKFWNYPSGWQEVVNYLNNIGYKVVSISKEKTKLNNVIKNNEKSIEETINTIYHSEFFIGVGSGPSWLAWGLRIPVVLISGFSAPFAEFQTGVKRVINEDVCHGCFNSTKYKFDRGDWLWCPKHKGTERHFECTMNITPNMVIKAIDEIVNDKGIHT